MPSVSAAKAEVEHNKKRQHLKPKGRLTREKIVASTLKLIAEKPLTTISITEIAAITNISPPAFYNYFADISEVVLYRLTNMLEERPEHFQIAASVWPTGSEYDQILALIQAYARYWAENRTVLWYRNLMCDRHDVDDRFLVVRRDMIVPITDTLSARVEHAQRSGHASNQLHAPSAAAAMLALMDRVASTATFPYGHLGWNTGGFLDAAATMVHLFLGDQGDFDPVADRETP